jgi:hypothetical protein
MGDTDEYLKEQLDKLGYGYHNFKVYLNRAMGKKNTPIIKYLKNARYVGNDIISIRFNENRNLPKKKGIWTIKKIQERCNKYSSILFEARGGTYNINMMVAIKYGKMGWKSGSLTKPGEEVRLYNPNNLYNLEVPIEEPKTIESFNIYLLFGPRNVGGNNVNNDCLYDCLKYYIFDIENHFESPNKLKTFLKLRRNDKISIDLIDKIEKKLKTYQINVRGDYIRSSTIVSNKQINLLLKNEHYEVDGGRKKLISIVRFEEKRPIILNKSNFEAYDGERYYTMSYDEFKNIKYGYQSPYIIIYPEKQGYDENGEKIVLTLEEEYNVFVEIANTLKRESKGLINLYKSGNYHDCALNLFDKFTKSINPEPIEQDEAIWIKDSSYSALIYAEKYEGEIHKYDVKSMYPSFMKSTTLKFPVKRGDFRIIENIGEYPEFGIYRLDIRPSNDININKLFKFNYHNKYTSIDVTTAKLLGLTIELIQDGKPNFLHYTRDKLITFNEVFHQYVNLLFPLKDLGIKKSKNILNILWGALCEIDKRKIFISSNTFEISDDEEIIDIRPLDVDGIENHIIKTVKISNYYKTSFARLCPFIIGQGRSQMAKIMLPYKDNIKQIQTDGFVCTMKIHENRDVKMGELKYEGYLKNGIIKHCNSKNVVE